MEEEILKTNEEEKINEIVEIDENEEINNTQYDLKQIDGKSNKKVKKPSKWSKLSKKTKIIIIVCSVLVILVILGIVLYFTVFKKDTDEKKNTEPVVVIEKDNYKYVDGKLSFLDKNKNEIGIYECENKSENLCYVANYSNEDDFDTNKRVYESGLAINNRSDIFENNFVFVYDNMKKEDGDVKLYDISKEKVLDTYSLVKEVKDNKVIVKKNNKYGLIELSEKDIDEVIKSTYEYMGYIEDTDALIVSSNSNYSLVDFTGKSISKNVPGAIKAFDDESISVKVGEGIYIYNYNGKTKVSDSYDYVRFINTYIIAADGKKLYVFDKDGSPMNMDGIKIKTNEYNTKLIFNDNLRQTGKEEAFTVTISDNVMKFDIDGETTKLNLNEGLFNKNMEYISYFAGKLYIYSDSEKTELLGTYACDYANNVASDDEVLSNCFIAKESNILAAGDAIDNGYVPIYNKRFVFITDTKTPNTNDNIVLYDLKAKKKIATYKAVDLGFHDLTNTFNFIDTAGTLVIAQSSDDGAYGIVNINQSDIKSFIQFRKKDDSGKVVYTHKEIKKLDEYFLFKASDGTYHLWDKNGEELTENVTTNYEIVEYKDGYIKVKNDDKYLIYSKSGKIVSDEFANIVMESKFYLTIDKDNVVGVYKYDSKNNLANTLENTIKLESNDYKKEMTYKLSGNILKISYSHNGNTLTEEINMG